MNLCIWGERELAEAAKAVGEALEQVVGWDGVDRHLSSIAAAAGLVVFTGSSNELAGGGHGYKAIWF